MASRQYEIAFQIGGKLQGSLTKSVLSAGGQLERLGKQISALEKAQGTSNRFRSLHREIDETKLKLRQAEGEVRHMGSIVGPMTADMARRFASAKERVEALRGTFRGQVTELKSVKAAMGAAGISAGSFAGDVQKLATRMERLKRAQAGIQGARGALDVNKQQMAEARGKIVGALAGVAAFVLPVKVSADLEDSMVRVGALARATDGELARLTATARTLGRDTRFSATQAASGMQFLAMSGFSTNEIISAMPGMLNIASAGAVELGEAADITSNILRGFGMQAGESGRLGDVLTNTFTQSNTTLSALGDTMKYVAPIAKATGVSLEMTAAGAGILANSGIKGEQAGTAMRAMLTRLAAPARKGQLVLAKLGVATKDAEGNMRPLSELLAELSTKMAKYGSGTRQAMTSAVFGLEAATAATVLIGEAGSGNLQKFALAVAKSGTAAEVAAKQNATLKGQWDNIKGAVEDLAIQIGQVLVPSVKGAIDWLVPLINKVTMWAQENPRVASTIVGISAGLAALNLVVVASTIGVLVMRGAWLKASLAFHVVQAALVKLNLAMLANPAVLMTAALLGLVAAGYLVGKNWTEIAEGGKIAWNAIRNAVVDTVAFLGKIDWAEMGKNWMRMLARGILAAAPIPSFAVEWLAKKLGLEWKPVLPPTANMPNPAAWEQKVVFTDRPDLGKQVMASADLMSSFGGGASTSSEAANMSVGPSGSDRTPDRVASEIGRAIAATKVPVSSPNMQQVAALVEKITKRGGGVVASDSQPDLRSVAAGAERMLASVGARPGKAEIGQLRSVGAGLDRILAGVNAPYQTGDDRQAYDYLKSVAANIAAMTGRDPAGARLQGLDKADQIKPARGGRSFTYSPSITVESGNPAETRAAVEKGLEASKKDFEKWMRSIADSEDRLAYE